jgi:hypothetical protein
MQAAIAQATASATVAAVATTTSFKTAQEFATTAMTGAQAQLALLSRLMHPQG